MNAMNREPLADVIERMRASMLRAQSDPAYIAQQAEERRKEHEQYLALLRSRCDKRRVPIATDIRRWVTAETLDGAAADAVNEALGRRGEAGRGRWAIIVLLGSAGVGKSSALARAVARHPRDAMYVFARDAALALVDRPRSFSSAKAAEELVDYMRAVDLLAVDELGTEPAALSPEILHLVAARCSDGLCTILAGNVAAAQFTGRYVRTDTRIASRLMSPHGTVVDLEGADLRVEDAP
jgi:DNA replication protein DnaC